MNEPRFESWLEAAKRIVWASLGANAVRSSASGLEFTVTLARSEFADAFQAALSDLEYHVSHRHEPAPTIALEAISAGPSEVEVRQWAIEQASAGRAFPHSADDRQRLEERANALTAYVLTGVMPLGDPE